MPRGKICPACGRIQVGVGTRHPDCQQQHDEQRNQRRRPGGHTNPAWQRHSRKLLTAWKAEHGNYCPGDEFHGAHPSRDLTVDHPTSLRNGGALLDQPLRVICRAANSRKGG